MAMRRLAGGTLVTSTPPMKMVPSVTASRPAIIREQRGLAAAGRPEQRAELAAVDGKVEVLDRLDLAVALLHAPQLDFDHLAPQSWPRDRGPVRRQSGTAQALAHILSR